MIKKTFAFILLILFNTHLSAFDVSFNISFPETCMEKSCFDKETIKKYREQYDKDIMENNNRYNIRPNELDTRKRTYKKQHFLYHV
jgi:hypothetical protein